MSDLRQAAQQALEAHSDRYQVVQDGYWWRVKIGDGIQAVGQCHTRTGALRLASQLHSAFHDGGFVVQEAISAALAQQAEPVACKEQITVEELAAALGWPGGISSPVQDKAELLRIVAHARVAKQAEPVQRKPATGAAPCAMDFGVPPLFAARAENYARWALAQRAEPVLNGMEQAFSSEAMSRRDERQGLPASQQRADPVAYSIQTPADAKLNRITPSLVTDGQHELQEHLGNSETAKYIVPLYAAPPRREWVPLTDEEIQNVIQLERAKRFQQRPPLPLSMTELARAIEAKLQEKNQ